MKDKILMIVFVLVLGSILTAALVAVNFYTTPVIEKNEEIATKSSILKALNISFKQDTVEDIFAGNVEEKQQEGTTYYVAKDRNIAFPYSGSGLWGPIEGIIAVQPDFETLKGITIIRQEETPGLGSRIGEAPYLEPEFEIAVLLVGEQPDVVVTGLSERVASDCAVLDAPEGLGTVRGHGLDVPAVQSLAVEQGDPPGGIGGHARKE